MSGKITIFDPNRIFSSNFVNSFFSDLPFSPTSNELEMYEDSENIVVKIKAPGFKSEDIDINVEDKVLTVSGNIKEENEEENKDKKYYYKEFRNESFSRSVTLPSSVKTEAAKAEFNNGILEIKLPKIEDAKPKRIQIKAK